MVRTSVDSTIEELARVKKRAWYHVKEELPKIELELKFLKMFFWCLADWKEAAQDVVVQEARGDELIRSAMIIIETALSETEGGLYAAALIVTRDWRNQDWRLLASNLLEKVGHFKSQVRQNCNALLDSILEPKKSSTSGKILEFIDLILENLKDLAIWKDETIAPVNKQVLALEKKLKFFRNIIDFTQKRCTEHKNLEDFLTHIQAWANDVACLSYLFWLWVNEMEHNIAVRMNIRLAYLLQKIHPCTPEVTAMYLEVLKTSKFSRSDTFLMGDFVTSFVDFLLENLAMPMSDHFEILQEGLIFLMTFLMDPPQEHSEDGKLILKQADDLVSEAASLICLLSEEEKDENTADKRLVLSDFLQDIDMLKAEVRKLFVQIPDSYEFSFIRMNGIGFVDFVLENIKKMLKWNANFSILSKPKVVTIQSELNSIRPILEYIMEGQNKQEELNELWTRIINVAYRAEYVINLCSIMDSPHWYNLICFFIVTEEIKVTQAIIENIQDKQMNNIGHIRAEMTSVRAYPAQATTSRIDDVIVGFEDEARIMIDKLTGGPVQLQVISIVGMPGQGKTTLAKKVYNHPSIQYHFHKLSWTCVSQVYSHRDLLLDILSGVTELTNHETTKMSNEQLAEQLRKYLLGQRYLIIFDDIWDIRAWKNLKESFPEQCNRSRIVFTSRMQNLAWQDEIKCIFHPLCPFSDEESWELLHKKVFHEDLCPHDLLEVGLKIAKDCKGLPLSIVLVAGLLARNNSLDWWKEIAENLSLRLSSERSMDFLELSYRHLPDYLKPCFLYFGVLAEDEEIRVQKLILLWIAEGFLHITDINDLEDLAMEYLMDLVNRSLVFVTQRSSKGGIKACSVHDLIREFCLTKAKEENFLQLIRECDVHHDSFDPPVHYKPYRLCLDPRVKISVATRPFCSNIHSLSFLGKSQRPYSIKSCIFKFFKFLKVLDLRSIWLDCSFPEDITMIVHLRYLAISGKITFIPPSIANLWNLETFIVKGEILCRIHLPKTFWKMKSLRHVDICELAYISFRENDAKESAQLDNLHTLSLVLLRDETDAEILLRRLPRLRKLQCTYSQKMDWYKRRYQLPPFSILSELESLNVDYAGIVFANGQAIEESLIRPFPVVDFPSSLRKLNLSKFRLSRRALSKIGQLPNLEVLKLRKMAFQSFKWYVKDGEFLSLKFLELCGPEIEEWKSSNEPFPSLQQLVLTHCDNLEAIPSGFGNICTLKIIELRHCCFQVENSARKILDEQRDMGNDDLKFFCL